MPKETSGVFDICGPVMIGPSSSHTAGVAAIGFAAQRMFGACISSAIVRLYGSLSKTGRGHNTDSAVIAGLMGFERDDERVSRAKELLTQLQNIGGGFECTVIFADTLPAHWHPNTLSIELTAQDGRTFKMRASSVGGGAISIDELDGYRLSLSGELPALLIEHHDEIGVIANITQIMVKHGINIAQASLSRREKGSTSMLVVETDSAPPDTAVSEIETTQAVIRVIRVP
jgi:L-serine dehydratase